MTIPAEPRAPAAPSEVGVPTDAGHMPAHLWVPETQSGPGLLVLQEIFGVTPYIKSRCADLAALGYVVLAPEVYWRLDDTEIDEHAPAFLEQAMGVASRLNWESAVADAAAAFEHLRMMSEVTSGAGILGFCFGGGLGFAVAAATFPDVLISYYGSALPQLLDLVPHVTAPSLHHFGTADSFLDEATVARVSEAVRSGPAEVVVELYDGADHAFDNRDHDAYFSPAASAAAWATTQRFLAGHLPR